MPMLIAYYRLVVMNINIETLEGIYMLYVVNGVINTDGSLIRGVERTSLPIIKLIITDRAHGVD